MRLEYGEYKIAVIPGDGIGKEVVPEGMRVLEVAGKRYRIHFTWDVYPWSCETNMKTGRMMPEGGIEQFKAADAIYLGAVGYPEVPDRVSLWGLLLPILREMGQYMRPDKSDQEKNGEPWFQALFSIEIRKPTME